MKLENLMEKLNSYRPGTFVKISWERDVSSAKAKKAGVSVIKKSEGVFRVDIQYENLAQVKEREEKVEIRDSWFKHSDIHYAILENKKDESKKYLQVFTGANTKVKTSMMVDGEVKNSQALYEEGMITKAALPSGEPQLVFTLGIDNIISFGNN